jgi:glycosyltransferase involved in cell wall biosynthesis
MRILHVTQTYHPFLERGGPTVKVRSIAEGLTKRGHHNTVLTSWYGRPYRSRRLDVNGVDVAYLRPRAKYRALTFNSGLRKFCRSELAGTDMIHIYGLYDFLGPVVSHYAFRLGIPYVVEPLGMTKPIDRSLGLKRVWHRIFGSPMIRNAAMVIATSRQEEREILETGIPRNKVALRYNGVDLEEYSQLPARGAFRAEWTIPEDEPVILFLGRIIPRKGVDLLIDAFAQACPGRGRLVVAGPEGEVGYVAKLRERARAQGIEERTIFAGPLYADAKKSAYADCDIFALPSRYENFANSVAEAIACNRPVIISDQCGISEFVKDHAGLVIPREIPSFVEGITRLLSDADLYSRFQRACPSVAARLSWKELLVTQEQLYSRAKSSRAVAVAG